MPNDFEELVETLERIEGHGPVRSVDVARAVWTLARLDEVAIAELASEGKFEKLFPFQIKASTNPPKLPSWEEVAARPEPRFPKR